jgi:hypothetical protein
MRQRVALLTVTLSLAAAGSALAFDVTPVIYDLSSLGTDLSSPTAQAPPEARVPMTSLPLTTPSLGSDSNSGEILNSENGLELSQPNRRPRVDPNAGAPRGGNTQPDPTPNPEPGTMLLLGSALVSGARYARRRRRA